MHYVVTRLAKA